MLLRRLRVPLALACAVAATAIVPSSGLAATAPAGTANLWIDGNGGSCARQATPGAYSDTAACSSMQAAAQACTAGDTIRMKAGTYGSQSVTVQKTSPGCTIIGEDGTTTGSIALAGAWITVDNFTVNGSVGASDVGTGLPNHVTYRNVDADSTAFWDGGQYITWQGGRLHDSSCNCEGHVVIQGYPYPISNVTIDGVQFDHLTRNADCLSSSCHNEVIRIDDNASNVTVRDSTFLDNDPNSATIFVGHKNCTSCGPSVTSASNITVENNFFDSSGAAYYSVQVPCTHNVLAYNTFLKPPYPNTCDSSIPDNSDLRYVGNLGEHPLAGCQAGTGISYDHNVWIATGTSALKGCGSSDKAVASGGFASDGFHLTSASPAIGAGSTSYCPAADHDGDARPAASTAGCDAGADQYAASQSTPDTTAPDTAITSAPSGSTTSTAASVAFTGSDNTTAAASLTFECALDGGAWAACTSPKAYNSLAAGSHTVAVRAKDAAGNVDASPATATWTVTSSAPADTTAPTTSITAQPASPTSSSSASFSFAGSDDTTAAGSLTFECSLDGAVFAACASPRAYSGLAVGDHTFAVRAKDAAGNVDASPATVTWTITSPAPVDSTAPDTTITSAPTGSTTSTSASIAFTGSDNVTAPGSLTFQCKLDGATWAACTSPKSYSGLAVGTHSVSVRAIDAAGNTDASPATATWTVASATPSDTTAPDTTITAGPANGTTSTGATFSFTGTDNVTAAGSLTFQCSLDNATYASCTSPRSYTGLAVGTHTMKVRAKDAAGNVDASPATQTWSIVSPDTVAPDTTITSQPEALSVSTSASFAFTGSDDRTAASALAFECQLDGGPWTACTSPTAYDGLALLTHTFAVRARDAAGNVDASPATASWTVLAPTLPDPLPDPGTGTSTPTPDPVPEPAATTVALTAPTAGATFSKTLSMAASATPEAGAKITRLEFWLDDTRIVKDSSAPYAATWSAPSRLSTGQHTLSVRAYDSTGAVASAAVTVLRTTSATKASLRRSAATTASLATRPADDGGTDLSGSARAPRVVATLTPCSGKATRTTQVKLRGSHLSGHQKGRVCVVRLSPIVS